MCGVIGLICEHPRDDLGQVAAMLLKTLEYRGYDSTGAAIQDAGDTITLVKGVGAPSVMVDELGITSMSGQILCGQVRWATFGAVTEKNSQPHHVTCKTSIYGAHNGNVTNSDALQAWLQSEGHHVRSDNDGEMVVHTVEHYFARGLAGLSESQRADHDARRACMRDALVAAARRLEGSYAAVIVDPVSRCVWAVKQGSSLYFGVHNEPGQSFGIASSDLSSVLKMTRVIVPLSEGEFVEYDAGGYKLFHVRDRVLKTPTGEEAVNAGASFERAPVRSRLRAKDTALLPAFETFMDQEIWAQEQTCRDVITVFRGGSEAARLLAPALEATPGAELDAIWGALDQLRDLYDDREIRDSFRALIALAPVQALVSRVPAATRERVSDAPAEVLADRLFSSERGFLADLLPLATSQDERVVVRLLDVLLEREELGEAEHAIDRFVELCLACQAKGGSIFVVCCGSSYHAAQAGALFFNEVAHTELIPVLPGEFRGQYARSLRDHDLLISVSQSGETKDLIDIVNDVIATGRPIPRVAIVNNVNSTLAVEKSEVVIPLRCGAEIAVPATKSYMNQLAVFYCLSLKLGQRRLSDPDTDAKTKAEIAARLEDRIERLDNLPVLIRDTFDRTDADVERAAQMLYLRPSIHILATRLKAVAREGALKIREVVLNHTEGFEGSEFKHGPNTILGFNTIFGPSQVDALLKTLGRTLDKLTREADASGLGVDSMRHLFQAVTDSVFSPTSTPFSLNAEEKGLLDRVFDRDELLGALYADYPLIFVTGPDERDLALTVSQINTHKIRGASTVVIAEDDPALRQAASKAPADNPTYASVYVALPRTNDNLMMVFSATVVLQRLALKMSLLKMQYLDFLGIKEHGVHPDVPKNVSKSITVD